MLHSVVLLALLAADPAPPAPPTTKASPQPTAPAPNETPKEELEAAFNGTPEGKVLAQVDPPPQEKAEKADKDEKGEDTKDSKDTKETTEADTSATGSDDKANSLGPPKPHAVPQTPAETVKAVVDRTDSFMKWFWDHGPTITIVVVLTIIASILMARISLRIANVLTLHRASGSSAIERDQRVRTLAGVIDYVGTVVIYAVAVLTIMDEVNVPVAPLLAGAGVVGLAVAFGAQSLIKDFFYGFLILFEGQYGVNDEVEIGSVIGVVERLTLRVTVIRDYLGYLHFIPNGQVTTVCNRSQGWSRSVVTIGVGYAEDLDETMAVMEQVGHELKEDPDYSEKIVGDPELWGVDDLGDSAVSIKMAIKVKPGEMHGIRRQLLRRIKRRFDELGIEIPFPQHVVHMDRPTEPTDPSGSRDQGQDRPLA